MNEMNPNETMNQGITPSAAMPQGMKIDDKAVKRMAGEAISQVDGVLGVDGNLADILKSGDDVTKGLAVTVSGDGKNAQVSAKIITEYGRNIPEIVENVQAKVAESLRIMASLTVDRVEVEITDTMTREDYQAKNSKSRGFS